MSHSPVCSAARPRASASTSVDGEDEVEMVCPHRLQTTDVKFVSSPSFAKLPHAEMIFYAVFWFVYFSTGLTQLYDYGETKIKNRPDVTQEFWPFSWQLDSEAYSFIQYLTSIFDQLPYILVYILFRRISSIYLNIQTHHMVSCAASVAFLLCKIQMGIFPLIFCVLIFTAHFVLAVKKMNRSFWLFNIAIMASASFKEWGFHIITVGVIFCSLFGSGLNSGSITVSSVYYLFHLTSMGAIRCLVMSQGVARIDLRTRREIVHEYFVSLDYYLYIPGISTGPLMLYSHFKEQSQTPCTIKWRWVFFRILRLIFWMVVSQLMLRHLFFMYIIKHDIVNSPLVVLMTSAWLYGQFFMLQYVQYYGWAGVFSHLAGVQMEDWPYCVSRIYSYKEKWRVFDRGLATVLKNCIYVPLGGNQRGLVRQILATLACFGYVLVFHGIDLDHGAWLGSSALQIFSEDFLTHVYQRTAFGSFLRVHLSPASIRRLNALVGACGMYLSYMVVFCFFVGFERGVLLQKRAVFNDLSLPMNAALVFMYYCIVQLGMQWHNSKEYWMKSRKKIV